MAPPPADLMTFARYAYVLCCLSDPQGAARIADEAGDQPVSLHEQSRQAGLTEGDGERFYAWVRLLRINAAAYVHISSQEGGGGQDGGNGSTGTSNGTGTPVACDKVGGAAIWDDDDDDIM